MKKKLVSILLALSMVVTMLSTMAFAAKGDTPMDIGATNETEGGRTKATQTPRTSSIIATLSVDGATLKDNIVKVAPPALGAVTLKVSEDTAYIDTPRGEGATYRTVKGAIAKAESGDTIQLETDITGHNSIPYDNTFDYTLDLNGKALRCFGNTVFTHNGMGTLTIMDSSTGGTISAIGKNNTAIYNYDKGKIIVTGGTISATGSAIYNNGSGSVHINGGTLKSTESMSAAGISNRSNGTVTITDGTVSGVFSGISYYQSDKVIVTGGNIRGSTTASCETATNGTDPVYQVTYTEPADNTGKTFSVTSSSYSLTKSTAIDGKWYVWLPEGEATATYDGTTYTTTVTKDNLASFNSTALTTTITNMDSSDDGKVIAAKVAEETTTAIGEAKKNGTGTRANIVAVNPTYVTPQTLGGMAAAAQKAGGTAWLFADSVVDSKVMVRVYLNTANAASYKENILLGGAVSGKDVDYTKNKFVNFDNKMAVVSLTQQKPFAVATEIAAKVDLTGLNTKSLYFYSYHKDTNRYYPVTTHA